MRSFKSFLAELYYKKTRQFHTPLMVSPIHKNNRRKVAELDHQLGKHYNYEGMSATDDHERWHLEDERNAFRNYTTSSRKLNGHLHKSYNAFGGYKPDQMPEDYHQEAIKTLDRALDRHPAPFNFHVYSGLHSDPRGTDLEGARGLVTTHASKAVMFAHLPAYTSTSIDPKTALSFSRNMNIKKKVNDGDTHHYMEQHIMKFHIPKGSKHGAYVEHYSTNGGENEFILKRGKNIAIHPEPEVQDHHEEHTIENFSGSKSKITRHTKVFIWHAHIEE